jgi:DUF1365 family protein
VTGVLPPSPPPSLVYRGTVLHKRLKPFVHELTYSVFSLLVDIDALDDLDRRLRLFGYNRLAPISLHDKDYGRRDGTPPRAWIDACLREHGLGDLVGGPVRLLTFPRLWGFVFNPLSIYYCHDATGRLGAVLYEVSNTFGESHGYLLPVEEEDGAVHQSADKIFHVSPFIEMDCRYRFGLNRPGEKLTVTIRQSDSAGDPILMAKHTARGVAITDAALAKAIAGNPLMTAKVIGGIHWEALKLWLKGAKFYAKPDLPARHVTR